MKRGVVSLDWMITLLFFQICTFWFVGSMMVLYDKYNETTNQLSNKKIFIPQRVDSTLKYTMKWDKVRLAIHQTFYNTFISIFFHIFVCIPILEWRGMCESMWFDLIDDQNNNYTKYYEINVLIVLLIFGIKLFLLSLSADITFYFTHRMFHESKYLYSKYHKFHHTFVNTFGMAATAAHPIEHILSNIPSIQVPPIIVGLPFGLASIFLILTEIQTVFSHSGYYGIKTVLFDGGKRLSGNDNNTPKYDVHHEFHHKFQNVEFGDGSYCDLFFKTRLKDKYPKTWNKIVKHCLDNNYILNDITTNDINHVLKMSCLKKR